MTDIKGKNYSYGVLCEGMTEYLRKNYKCFNLDNLAFRAGISTSLLSRVISGQRSMTPRTFDRMLSALNSLNIDFSDYIKE